MVKWLMSVNINSNITENQPQLTKHTWNSGVRVDILNIQRSVYTDMRIFKTSSGIKKDMARHNKVNKKTSGD